MIQARQQRVRFARTSRTLRFELRVISPGRFLSDEYSAPVAEKEIEAIEYWSLFFSCMS